MQTSLPSKRIAIVDVPETLGLTSTFTYNFFVKDERVNDLGMPNSENTKISSEMQNTNYEDKSDFNRFTPRYNKLTWKPTIVGNKPDLIAAISVEENYQKIHTELDFGTDDFCPLVFQDTGMDGKLEFYTKKAIERLDPTGEFNTPAEFAKRLAARTSADVSGDFLATTLFNPAMLGQTFYSADTNKSLFDDLRGVKFRISGNNKILGKLLQTIKEDVVSPYADEVDASIDKAKTIESQSAKISDSSIFRNDDYDLEIEDYISVRKIDATNYDSVVQTVGYIIEKSEVQPDGTLLELAPIFIENVLISSYPDTQIKYGSTYVYKIRTVAYLEFQAQELAGSQILAVGFLVSSQPSESVTVNCNEEEPPPPPVDFNIVWDYNKRCTRLSWCFPPNTQRDIKKFQIFRRSSVYEPYQLIKMYDFDDSVVKSPYFETPDDYLVESQSTPKTIYFDHEFSKSSKCIYALCSVDAHGFSSGYSMQLQVSFDIANNRLIKKLISITGAPKVYPNAYINMDTFVDTIKDENHGKLRIVFNPEYLKVVDAQQNDLGLLKTGQSDEYRLQIINIDLQKQENVSISLNNRTTRILQNSN